jgi:hypothetical protein
MAKKLLLTILVAAGVLMTATLASGASTDQRIDLKLLVLAPSPSAGGVATWKSQLDREGVPYDVVYGDSSTDALTPDMLSMESRAYYQGVVVIGADASTDWDATVGPTGAPPGFSRASWSALHAFESKFGLRQYTVADWTGPVHGYLSPTAGTGDGIPDAALTDAGKQTFPDLKGPVNIEKGSWVMLTRQCDVSLPALECNAASVTPLLKDAAGNELLNAMITKDGREELVSTIKDSGPTQFQAGLLTHGLINWVTGGTYLGNRRNHLEMHVDDVFLADNLWDVATHSDPGDAVTPDGAPEAPSVRMVASDVTRLVNWQNARKLKLDMVFNGSGTIVAKDAPKDALTTAFMQNKGQFWWINHTWTHLNLNTVNPLDPTSAWVSRAAIEAEIQQNVDWATKNGLPFDKSELVTGEHSGLLNPLTGEQNPNLAAAFTSRGIKTAGSDSSRQPAPYTVGPARTVPRYPTSVYYNVTTWQQQLDEYSWLYTADDPNTPDVKEGGCVATATTTCFGTPGQLTSQSVFLDNEATNIMRHLLNNDPRPHYAHQSNLAGDGILYSVLDEVLRRYNAAYNTNTPIVQLKQQQISDELTRQASWKAARESGQVTGYLLNGEVILTNTGTSAVEVPVTGMLVGGLYGGHRSGWTTVGAGAQATLSPYEAPANTAVPTISGAAKIGTTMTASPGTWTGTPAPTSFTYQWQRKVQTAKSGTTTITDIAGATGRTYTATAADSGAQLRVIVTAANIAGTGTGASAWSGNVK